jgi:hypothetical protein
VNRDFYHSFIGTVAPVLGVVNSMQEQVEYWLRVSGLVVGLLVGLLSLWQLVRKL